MLPLNDNDDSRSMDNIENQDSKGDQNGPGRFCYRYPHPAVTCDCVIFGFDGRALQVLLIERGVEPYKGLWALPGGFMKIDETIEECAKRELAEETNLRNVYMEQFRVFSTVNRDPRERVITVAFMALVRPSDYELCAGDDASNALWFNESRLPLMAFDHYEILAKAREHLEETLRLRPVAFQLLGEIFSLSELQRVYEAITRTQYDRRNFQRKAIQSGMIEEANDPTSPRELLDEIYPYPASRTPEFLSEPHFDMSEEIEMERKRMARMEEMREEHCKRSPSSSSPSSSPSSSRRAMRMFRLKRSDKKNHDDSDGSIKDLFQF